MDSVNSIHDIIIENLQNENRILTISKLFTEFETDIDRYEIGSILLDEFDISPEVDDPQIKSAFESEKLRNEGNSAFLKRQDLNAIQSYTSSAGYAPNESKELALAYANRSAVTFALKKFEDCLTDIDRALQGHYPDNLRYKLYERKGKCFKYLGLNASAKENFTKSLEWVSKSNLSKEKVASFKLTLELSLDDLELEKDSTDGRKITGIKIGNQEELQLSFPPNEEILCACDALKIEYSEEFGRHVVATKDILPGQVLAIERPFASILLPASYNEYCFHCLKRCHSLLPCTGCTKVFFCSSVCREVSWSMYHCIDCSLLERLYNFECSNLEILSVRTLILAARVDKFSDLIKFIDELQTTDEKNPRKIGYNERDKYDSEDYRTSHFLARNTHLRTPADLFRRVVFAVCAIHFIDRYTDFFEINSLAENDDSGNSLHQMRCQAGGLLLRYMQIIPCNGHEVSEMCVTLGVTEKNNNASSRTNDGSDCLKRSTNYFDYACNEIGSALYPFLSLINHSCDPNVVRHSYNGDFVVLSAIQAIQKGEQILDSYSHHYAMHDETTRRSQLLQQYHFNCACIACTSKWPLYNDLPEQTVTIKEHLQKEVTKSSEEFRTAYEDVLKGDFEGKLPIFLNHLSLLHGAIARPCKEYNQCQEAIKMCLCLRTNHYVLSKL